jgi:uncharacterized alkaline shock family protein YloU
MPKKLSYEAESQYSNIVASIANNAIVKTDGVMQDFGVTKHRFGMSALRNKNIMVHVEEERAILDIHVNVSFGFSVPEVVCSLQERIKSEVEANTSLIVQKTNVHVTNALFDY